MASLLKVLPEDQALSKERARRGNTLAMIAVVTIVLIGVILFVLLYVSMMRSGTEHRTAIESAALAAAKDISRIAIDTPEFGWVSLSTEAPTGTDTKAPDNWFQQVKSVNELMATARLDMIIAAELGDPFMHNLALADFNNVIRVKNALTTQINNAIASGGSARDSKGATITPYLSAERIYLANQAKGSTYVPNSLRLSLGGIEGGIETSTLAPKPLSKGACAGREANNHYLSEMVIPFGGTDFVFGSVAKKVRLCEKEKFRSIVPGLPYQMPGVIRVEAVQQFQDQGKTWTVNYAACAAAGSFEPERPAPGALTLSFPDGPVPEITKAGQAWGWAELNGQEMSLYQASGGDFIVDSTKGATLVPWAGPPIPFTGAPTAAEVTKLALYDWIRCGGSNVDIDSIIALNTAPLDPPVTPTTLWRATDPGNPPNWQIIGDVPTGVMHIFTFNKNGTYKYVSKTIKPYPYTTVGENQLFAELKTDKGLKSDGLKANKWKLSTIKFIDTGSGALVNNGEVEGGDRVDLYVRDLARLPGTKLGGQHGGERLDGNPNVSYGGEYRRSIPQGFVDELAYGDIDSGFQVNSSSEAAGTTGGGGAGAPTVISRQDDFASTTIPAPPYTVYSQGPGPGAPRPAYLKNGVAADIRYRRQVKVGKSLAVIIGNFKTGYIGEMLPYP